MGSTISLLNNTDCYRFHNFDDPKKLMALNGCFFKGKTATFKVPREFYQTIKVETPGIPSDPGFQPHRRPSVHDQRAQRNSSTVKTAYSPQDARSGLHQQRKETTVANGSPQKSKSNKSKSPTKSTPKQDNYRVSKVGEPLKTNVETRPKDMKQELVKQESSGENIQHGKSNVRKEEDKTENVGDQLHLVVDVPPQIEGAGNEEDASTEKPLDVLPQLPIPIEGPPSQPVDREDENLSTSSPTVVEFAGPSLVASPLNDPAKSTVESERSSLAEQTTIKVEKPGQDHLNSAYREETPSDDDQKHDASFHSAQEAQSDNERESDMKPGSLTNDIGLSKVLTTDSEATVLPSEPEVPKASTTIAGNGGSAIMAKSKKQQAPDSSKKAQTESFSVFGKMNNQAKKAKEAKKKQEKKEKRKAKAGKTASTAKAVEPRRESSKAPGPSVVDVVDQNTPYKKGCELSTTTSIPTEEATTEASPLVEETQMKDVATSSTQVIAEEVQSEEPKIAPLKQIDTSKVSTSAESSDLGSTPQNPGIIAVSPGLTESNIVEAGTAHAPHAMMRPPPAVPRLNFHNLKKTTSGKVSGTGSEISTTETLMSGDRSPNSSLNGMLIDPRMNCLANFM